MDSIIQNTVHVVLALALPPLLLGVIAKTKALFAGRVGPPLLQIYYDLVKLFQKGSVFSTTTTWVFRAGPVVGLVTATIAILLIPLANSRAPISFTGDLILLAYLLGLGRFFTATAALDTGSAFEGMGAAREVTFACLAEPAFFLGLLVLAKLSGSLQLATMLGSSLAPHWTTAGASLVLVLLSWFIVLLAENSRIPFDDPNTHLELTMIHEVMVLDHSGPAFGMILYGGGAEAVRLRGAGRAPGLPPDDRLAVAGLAGLRCGDAGGRGGDRGSGIDYGAPAPDARSGPARRCLPAIGFRRHPAGEVNRMVQVLDPLLIVALALNFVALGVSRIRGVISAVAVQGMLLGILPLFVHPENRFRVILLIVVTIGLKGFVIPGFLVHAMREANIQHEVKPVVNYMSFPSAGGGRHRPGAGVLVHASPGRAAQAAAARAGVARDGVDRLPDADDAQEGHHAGAGLPAPGERDLPVRPAAPGSDAVPRRGRRAARPVHRRVRDGHHHPPHQSGVRLRSAPSICRS